MLVLHKTTRCTVALGDGVGCTAEFDVQIHNAVDRLPKTLLLIYCILGGLADDFVLHF